MILLGFSPQISVSTHSHPKVAAISFHYKISFCCCFNTQPPEGGCKAKVSYNTARRWFQHTATRRWLPLVGSVRDFMSFVSTHSHPKVAALYPIRPWWTYLSFNTQPPEGGCLPTNHRMQSIKRVSTHSHPKVAARESYDKVFRIDVSTHSHPKVAAPVERRAFWQAEFQHTATRRWLPLLRYPVKNIACSFQHTATRRWLRVGKNVYLF